MNRIGALAAGIGLAAQLLTFSGCASGGISAQQDRFVQIASHLDPGGSFYTIQNTVQLQRSLPELRREWENQLWSAPLPLEQQKELQIILSSAELLLRSLGFHEIEGIGASSFPLEEELFRNRLYVALPPQAAGVLWQLPESGAMITAKEIETLPAHTSLAIAAAVNAKALARLRIPGKLFPALSPEFCASLSGKWKLAMIHEPGFDPATLQGIQLQLVLPDKDGKLWETLSRHGKMMRARTELDGKRLCLPGMPPFHTAPAAEKRGDEVFIFSSQEALRNFTTPATRLVDRPDFLYMASKLAPCGSAVFWMDESRTPFVNSYAILPQTPARVREIPLLGMLQHRKNGIEICCLSAQDLNEQLFRSAVALPVSLLGTPLLAPVPNSPAPRVRRPARIKKSDRKKLTCEAQMKKIYAALEHFKKSDPRHHYPEKHGIPGLRELLKQSNMVTAADFHCPAAGGITGGKTLDYRNCSYFYFGNPPADSPHSVLLLEPPLLHRDGKLRALLADGSIAEIPMEPPALLPRAVSILHTKYQYEEKEFLRLMKIAVELDDLWER